MNVSNLYFWFWYILSTRGRSTVEEILETAAEEMIVTLFHQ